MFWHLAKRLRNKQVLKYITAQDSHLDIGCGDWWLLDRSPAYRTGYIWFNAEGTLPYVITKFSKITLVAVLEHLDDPALVMRECCRLLVDGGQILITAPTLVGELFVPLICNFKPSGHKRVITLKSLQALLPSGWKITRHFFELGLNCLYIVER